MKPIGELLPKLLTATREPPTLEKPVNIETWAKWARFELWGDQRVREQLARMLTATARFCQEVKASTEPRWLSFLGTSGGGKTYLARRIWDWYRTSPMFEAQMLRDSVGRKEVQYPGQWRYWPELAGQLSGNEGYDALVELATDRFVVFDEIGAERDPNGHVRDCLARTLCSRVGKWTIITSNKTLEKIASQIDGRIASRMVRDGSVIVETDMPDYSIWKSIEDDSSRQ